MNIKGLYFKVMDRIWPSFLAKQVYHFMSNPNIRKLRDFEEVILDQSVRERVAFREFELQTYSWGDPKNKTVLMIHGWEGQAGNFGALVDLLLEKNYHVVSYDGPSHGRSSKGNTSMFEMGDVATFFMQKYEPSYLVSHSFGSISTIYGLVNHPTASIEKWLVVTTPHNFKDRIQGVAELLGVTDRTIGRVIKKVERDTGESIEVINVDDYSLRLQDNLKEVLLVHSKSDKILPIEDSRKVQKALGDKAQLIELENLGHYSILWSDDLKEIVGDYF
ncbi:MAG: alpha/beta hydrolase [Aureispira sp.]